MKRTLLLLPAIACLSLSVFAQVPVDKTVSLQSVEIQGKRFGGLTGGEVKRLQVDSNLSGLTGTTADVFRLLPSVVTDIEGGITFRGSNNPGLLINGVPYGLLEEYSGDADPASGTVLRPGVDDVDSFHRACAGWRCRDSEPVICCLYGC